MTILEENDVEWFKTSWGDESQCKFCGSSVHWEDCDQCGGEGYSWHDCGEDTCCCLDPVNNMPCDICDGAGGWYVCLGNCGKKKPTLIQVAAEQPEQTKLTSLCVENSRNVITAKSITGVK